MKDLLSSFLFGSIYDVLSDYLVVIDGVEYFPADSIASLLMELIPAIHSFYLRTEQVIILLLIFYACVLFCFIIILKAVYWRRKESKLSSSAPAVEK